MMVSTSAFEILCTTRQLPVAEKELVFAKVSTKVAASRSAAGSAWGKSARKWVAASSSSPSPREFGDVMSPELRTLVATSFDVFTRSQTHEMSTFGILRASREYREALKTCILGLEDRFEAVKEEKMEGEEQGKFIDLMRVSLAILHLCELLLLRGGVRGADRALAYDLARWVQEYYCRAKLDQLTSESERLQTQQQPEQDPAFWTTIQSLVMAGSGASAWSVLASHSTYKSLFSRDAMSLTGASTKTTFHAIQKLLLTMPGSAYGTPKQVGPAEWKNWHDACQCLLNTDTYVKANEGMKTLLEIMVAKEEVLISHASTWYELMMARLFLEEPKTIAHRFEFLMANCFRAYNRDGTQMGNFDCIIRALMEYDIQSALQDIIALGLSWMAAHLVDLLQKSNVIVADELMPKSECTLRERFLLEYAMDIGASSGMWQFAVRYYEYCPKFGAIAIRSALEREPLTTDYKAERLLAYCHGKTFLTQTFHLITIHRAQECKEKKMYASALQWMQRGNHLDDIDALCDEILQECKDQNSLTPLHEAVQFMETQAEHARPQTLAWLIRYREFRLVLDDSEALRTQLRTGDGLTSLDARASLDRKLRFVSMEAAKRLDWLVGSAEVPKGLRSEVLQQAERLLKESPTVFLSRHLYSLMAYLQQLDRSFDCQEFFESSSNKQLKERIESLISRNLVEAMLQEASGCAAASSICQSNAALTAQQPYLAADSSLTPMEE
ncbi:hypothetical protein PsorP6_005548 [Peronosclerospora sorghi]|uniref:Uncharacterized protein n=1 Tax=Peronosclerospora sorghi TaxID=230839 RepID=A0ACC0W2R7_9STRA|nr:hypothetical protein PsorP6_005548 [Peronosclerospora sorghi]